MFGSGLASEYAWDEAEPMLLNLEGVSQNIERVSQGRRLTYALSDVVSYAHLWRWDVHASEV